MHTDQDNATRQIGHCLGAKTRIVNDSGDLLGYVDELLICPRRGHVLFVNVRLARSPERHTVVPWSAFTTIDDREHGQCLRLRVNAAALTRLSTEREPARIRRNSTP